MSRTSRFIFAGALAALFSSSTASAQVTDTFRIGAIRLAHVARASQAGKTALAAIDDVGRKRMRELETRAGELEKQQIALEKQAGTMSPRAVADLRRAFDKSRLEFERLQQDAQAEIESMQVRFDNDFRAKVGPIIEAISREKGLHFVFGVDQAPMIAWWNPAVDISEEVVKRLDAPR